MLWLAVILASFVHLSTAMREQTAQELVKVICGERYGVLDQFK